MLVRTDLTLEFVATELRKVNCVGGLQSMGIEHILWLISHTY